MNMMLKPLKTINRTSPLFMYYYFDILVLILPSGIVGFYRKLDTAVAGARENTEDGYQTSYPHSLIIQQLN